MLMEHGSFNRLTPLTSGRQLQGRSQSVNPWLMTSTLRPQASWGRGRCLTEDWHKIRPSSLCDLRQEGVSRPCNVLFRGVAANGHGDHAEGCEHPLQGPMIYAESRPKVVLQHCMKDIRSHLIGSKDGRSGAGSGIAKPPSSLCPIAISCYYARMI